MYKVAMWERVKNSKTISVIVNGEEYEEFKDSLPKGKTVGEYIRQCIHEELEVQKKDKALTSLNYSPIQTVSDTNNNQSSLDKFIPKHLRDRVTLAEYIRNQMSDKDILEFAEYSLMGLDLAQMIGKEKTGLKPLFGIQIKRS